MNKYLDIMVIYGVVSEILYLLLFLVEPIRKSMGETGIALKSNMLFFGVILLLSGLTMIYIQVYKDFVTRISINKIIVFSLIFQLTLFFVKPMGADDVFSYIYKARVYSVHHQNPYIVTYSDIHDDAFTGRIENKWSGNTAVYGPVFMLFSGVLTVFSGNNLWLSVYLLKFFAVFANVFIIYLLYLLTKDKKAVYLYAWNPYVLFVFAVDGHNDVYLLLFMLLSVWFLTKAKYLKDYIFAVLSLLFSILIKYFSVVTVPFFALYLFKKLRNEKKLSYLPWLILISVISIILLYLPFWDGPVPFKRLFELSQKEEKSTSLLILVSAITLSLMKVKNYFEVSSVFAKIVFLFLYIKLLVNAFKAKLPIVPDLVGQYLLSLVLLFFIVSTWFLPWYSTVTTAFLALYIGLRNNYKYVRVIYALTIYQLIFSVLTR